MPYTPQVWADDDPSKPLSAARLTHIESGITTAGALFNVKDAAYGAIGNGIADDTIAIQAAITAAQAVGGTVYSPSGNTYIINSNHLVVSGTCQIDFSGSTIKAQATLNQGGNALLSMIGSNCVLRNIVVDGNSTNGATICGIDWQSANGRLYDCVAKNCHGNPNGFGFQFRAGCDGTRAYRITADNVTGTGLGIYIQNGDVQVLDVLASNCDYAGIWVNGGGYTKIVITGRAEVNNFTGLGINGTTSGSVPKFVAYQNNQFGITVFDAGNWEFGEIEADFTGHAPGYSVLNSGTGVEFYGAQHCSIASLKARGNPGYGLALAGNGSVASRYCTFGRVYVDQTDSGDGDPGVVFANAQYCSIGNLHAINHTWAISHGEVSGALGNDHNSVGTLHATGISFGLLTFGYGSHLHIGRIISRNCWTSDLTFSRGLLHFVSDGTYPSHDNTIGFIDHYNEIGTPQAAMIAYFGGPSNMVYNNRVLDGYNQSVITDSQDVGGANSVNLRYPVLSTRLYTADAGESWGTTTDNTTAGQFIQGTGSKKITPVQNNWAAAFSIAAIGPTIDALAATDVIRLWVYFHNYQFGYPIQVRLTDNAHSAYFERDLNTNIFQAGGQYVYLRKGDFAVAGGSPVMASVNSFEIWDFGNNSLPVWTMSVDDVSIVSSGLHRTVEQIGNIGANAAVPSTPDAHTFKLFARDNGAGKTQAGIVWDSGDITILATEP